MSVRPFPAEAGELFTKQGDEWAHTVPAYELAKTALHEYVPPFSQFRGFRVHAPAEVSANPDVHVVFGVGENDHDRMKPLLGVEWATLDARTQLALRSMAGEMITEADVFAATEQPDAELRRFVPAQVIALPTPEQQAA